MGRLLDVTALAALLYIALALFMAAQLRNMVGGALVALPVLALLLYAYALWKRKSAASVARDNAHWQLHNLMLAPFPVACKTLSFLVAKQHGIEGLREQGDQWIGMFEGRQTALTFLQRPMDMRIGSEEILRLYHACSSERVIVMSSAPFTGDAAVFARQLRSPAVALAGPEELYPLLSDLPADDAERENDKKKRRVATLRELRIRACDPARTRRYLFFGAAMLMVYIALGLWPFLLPGLVCVFLAVIAGRQSARKEPLFPKD